MEEDGEEERGDGKQVDQVHRLEQELELARGAQEPHDILEREVDHADGVDRVQQVDDLPVPVHPVIGVVGILGLWKETIKRIV